MQTRLWWDLTEYCGVCFWRESSQESGGRFRIGAFDFSLHEDVFKLNLICREVLLHLCSQCDLRR